MDNLGFLDAQTYTADPAQLVRRLAEARAALAVADDQQRRMAATTVAALLLARAQQVDDSAGLDEAIDISRHQLAQFAPASDAGLVTSVILVGALSERHRRREREEDLDEVVMVCRRVLLMPASHPLCAPLENYFGGALMARFMQRRDPQLLDTAMHWFRSCLAHANGQERLVRAGRNNLAMALRERYELTADTDDLDEATMLSAALAEANTGHSVDKVSTPVRARPSSRPAGACMPTRRILLTHLICSTTPRRTLPTITHCWVSC